MNTKTILYNFAGFSSDKSKACTTTHQTYSICQSCFQLFHSEDYTATIVSKLLPVHCRALSSKMSAFVQQGNKETITFSKICLAFQALISRIFPVGCKSSGAFVQQGHEDTTFSHHAVWRFCHRNHKGTFAGCPSAAG